MLRSWSLLMVCGLSLPCLCVIITFLSHWGYADIFHLMNILPASRRYSPNITLLCGGWVSIPITWCSLWNSEMHGMLSLSPCTAISIPAASSTEFLLLVFSSQDAMLLYQPPKILAFRFLAKRKGCGLQEVAVSTCAYKGGSLTGVLGE